MEAVDPIGSMLAPEAAKRFVGFLNPSLRFVLTSVLEKIYRPDTTTGLMYP